MMEFLYFPEDKTEYIPGIISLVIFMIGAAITMYIFIKKSKKEEQLIDQQYKLNANNIDDADE
ncbi:hypothetical protein [Virgibacillus ndiopensis]|uniref:hypothetical protein n=1 Tax=Virgibacillus ndiopensis TaxID=2004408 RepID=UPI000C07A982|nr:hypothetical protein [Virgibacillus ndiopensis]